MNQYDISEIDINDMGIWSFHRCHFAHSSDLAAQNVR